VLLPELGAAVLSGKSLADLGVRKALRDAFICDGGDPLSMDSASFSLLTPAFDTMDLAVIEATPKTALEHIRLLQSSIATLHALTVAARASMERCFDLYKLACMTKGANWLTVQQLQFRERVDRSQAVFDSVNAPLVSWEDKTRAALIACDQTHTMSREGILLGPVCPSVVAALARAPRGSLAAGAAAGVRASVAGTGRRKAQRTSTAAGGAKDGIKKRSRSSRGGKKATAGAAPPPSAAAAPAAASP